MDVVTVVNFKGGSSKTTTAAYVACGLAELGRRVLAVDADPQGSLSQWAALGGWSVPVAALATPNLHTQLRGLLGDHDVIVIDTPPVDAERGIAASAVRAATLALIPLAPTPVEVDRLGAIADMVRAATVPAVRVLLTRTVPNAASTEAWRGALASVGWPVLAATVPRRESIAQAFGDPLPRVLAGPYGDAVRELAPALSSQVVTS